MLKKFIATTFTTMMCLCTAASAFAATFESQWEMTEAPNFTVNNFENDFGKILASKPPIKIVKDYFYYFPVGTTFAWEVGPKDKEYYEENPSSYNLSIIYSEETQPGSGIYSGVSLASGPEVTLTSDMFGKGMLQLQGHYMVPFLDIIVLNEGESPSSIPTTLTAVPTTSSVHINGIEVLFDTYTIEGQDFFKLRDLAYSLNETEKQFEISWDSEANVINLLSNKDYTSNGSEMTKGDGANKNPVINNKDILLDGKEIQSISYIIDENNYFSLHDIGELFNFSVVIDSGIVKVDTSMPYEE